MKASLDGPRDGKFNSTHEHPRESIIQLGKIVKAGRKTVVLYLQATEEELAVPMQVFSLGGFHKKQSPIRCVW